MGNINSGQLTCSNLDKLGLSNYQNMMSLDFCLDAVELVCLNLYTNDFLPSKFVHEFLKFGRESFLLFSRIRVARIRTRIRI